MSRAGEISVSSRWTAKKKAEVVIDLFKRYLNLVDFCREQDLKQSDVQIWMDEFTKAGTDGLRTNAKTRKSEHNKELDQLKKAIGELTLSNMILKKSIELQEQDENE
jgi:hypothetical protein